MKKSSPLPTIIASLVCLFMFGGFIFLAVTQEDNTAPQPITNCVAGTYLQADNTCLPLDSTRSK